MNRTDTKTVVVALMLVLAVPAGIAGAATNIGALPAADNLPEETVGYGADATPGFVVQLTNETNASTLEAWANQSASREIEQAPTANGLAVVSAPQAVVTGGLLAFEDREVLGSVQPWPTVNVDGLATESWVKYVEPELTVSRLPPVTLQSNETYTAPGSYYTRLRAGADADTFGPRGVAFSGDANTTTMAEARALYNVSAVTSNGSGVSVAVLDTGANVANGTLFGNGTSGSDIRISNASKSFVDGGEVNASAGDYSAIADGNGHGTWVASAVAANHSDATYDGMAPGAELLVLKTLDDEGSGSSADIAEAIRYAADQNADIISMSLGSQVYSKAIASAVKDAEEQGSIVVIAAGNSRANGVPFVASPADTPNSSVVTVAAANGSDAVANSTVAYFSQVGPDPGTTDLSGGRTQGAGVTVSAVGMAAEAMVVPDGASYTTERTLSGTSMATPQVSGVIALALAENPSWKDDPEAVHERLQNSSRPMPRAAVAEAGAGMVNAKNLNQSYSPQSQRLAQTDRAEARDAAWRGLSASSGGFIARILGGAGDFLGGVIP